MSVEVTDDGLYRLDAREIDGEPFGDIMAAVDELGGDDTLLLVNSFEPVPLFGVLGERGYETTSEQIEEDLWHVYIEPE